MGMGAKTLFEVSFFLVDIKFCLKLQITGRNLELFIFIWITIIEG